ncbi:NUDIX hydrolase [Planomicrobium okeanokoites]|uniref:NUDIX hydrolase n=1 Tax=Planomicrobium okeanokoites TaxID=244 RepID=A0ABV7KTF4_PLAOK|nr:NUDIX hydrolase [Planomicrobium okeanokoites]TAA70311.1 NUDIX hydrolase [Planomicrobium okeanokoites]
MGTWYGAAGICINESSQLLMVLEGETVETQKWSIPTGGLEKGETFEQCVLREIEEETGFTAEILMKLKVKKGVYEHLNIAYEVHYFAVNIIGGEAKIQDPDESILDIAWKPAEELRMLPFSYPEDREELLSFLAAPETFST